MGAWRRSDPAVDPCLSTRKNGTVPADGPILAAGLALANCCHRIGMDGE